MKELQSAVKSLLNSNYRQQNTKNTSNAKESTVTISNNPDKIGVTKNGSSKNYTVFSSEIRDAGKNFSAITISFGDYIIFDKNNNNIVDHEDMIICSAGEKPEIKMSIGDLLNDNHLKIKNDECKFLNLSKTAFNLPK